MTLLLVLMEQLYSYLSGFGRSMEFKTNAHHKYQAVQITPYNMRLLQFYDVYLRPRLQRTTPLPDSPLWLNYEGNRDQRLGKRVIEFFKYKMNLAMGTTALRSMLETLVDKLVDEGSLTELEQNAVVRLNNHSSVVSKNFYVMKDQRADVSTSRHAMEKILSKNPNTLQQVVDTQASDAVQQFTLACEKNKDVLLPPALGLKHPHYGSKAQRIPWTDAEIQWIESFVQAEIDINVKPSGRLSRLRSAIITDATACKLFHVHHVVDVSRLDWGLKKCMKTLANSA
jgi:hypothetical protein